MADIVYRRKGGAAQLIVNGVDLTMDVFADVELVEVGEGLHAECGLRVTLAVSRLDLDQESDIEITDHFPAVAQRVRSITEAVSA